VSALAEWRAFVDAQTFKPSRSEFVKAWRGMSGGKNPPAAALEHYGARVVRLFAAACVEAPVEMLEEDLYPAVDLADGGDVLGWPLPTLPEVKRARFVLNRELMGGRR